MGVVKLKCQEIKCVGGVLITIAENFARGATLIIGRKGEPPLCLFFTPDGELVSITPEVDSSVNTA